MKKSKHTLAEFEITDGGKTEIKLFGRSLSATQVRSMLVMYDGYSHKIIVKKLKQESES
jgi:hypothetical protein